MTDEVIPEEEKKQIEEIHKLLEKGLTKPLNFTYFNWKGNLSQRRAVPISIRYGHNEFHKEDDHLMLALDLEKDRLREFVISDMIFEDK